MASNVLKTRYGLPDDLDRFQEHRHRSHPKAENSVLLPVDDEFLLGFAVPCHAEDRVLPALVMAVAAGGMLFIGASLLQPVHHRPDLVQRMLVGGSGTSLMAGDFRLEVVVVGFFGQSRKHLHPADFCTNSR